MPAPLNILLTGASGFIGSTLARFLRTQGHHPIPLVRSQAILGAPSWNPDASRIDLGPAGKLDAVVHLAGYSIARRWTRRTKERIRQSRVHGTQLLSQALARLQPPAPVLVAASAVGFYGHRGDTLLTEFSPPGTGFLAEVAQAWEAATQAAQARGIRVVHLRIGLVLSSTGGALARMLPLFRLGLGGRLSHGRQYWSWIALEDLHRAFLHALATPSLEGPVNAVAPHPVTNRDFTLTLGRCLNRPACLPVPAFALRLLFGSMADEALLSSTRVFPAQLEQSGFRFLHPRLETALASLRSRAEESITEK